ncbi:MAG: hypothetical protein OXG95_04795 [Chloroflexi bacterium]|nr:hypothetical protein [Chloroflexota bacterium]
MEEAPAEAVVDVVGDAMGDLVTRGDLNSTRQALSADLDVAVAQLTAELHRALRVQGMWIVGTIVGLATIASLMVATALMVLGVG